MTDSGTVQLSTTESGVTTLVMNRPEKLNSWDEAMEEALRTTFVEIEGQLANHRVLVIRGAGRAFCAGVDMGLVSREQTLPARALRTRMSIRHRILDWIEQVEIPVIAAVHGYCLGGGFELAIACDFRLVSTDARLAMPELSFGQVPGSGAASRLTALAGPAVAKDLIMTGRQLDADEALKLGLASRVYPSEDFDARTLAFAEELAARPPLAVAMVKQTVTTVQPIDLSRSRVIERLGQSVLLGTEDLAEGLAAASERRPPKFTGR